MTFAALSMTLEMTPEMTQETNIGPLADIRILDLSTVLAGPFGATLCADLGADVIKIELPDGSDALRKLEPSKDGMPLYWKVTNRGKRGVTLDVRKPGGRAAFLRMAAASDVIVENFRSGKLEDWGLGMDVLHEVNPRLVVLRLTGFGQTGPYRQKAGFARIFEAMSGLTNLTGEPGGMPLHTNFPLGDTIAGLFGAFSIAAEMVRMRANPDARGVEIDLSATEALFRLLEPLAVEYEQSGTVRGHQGNNASYTAPSNMYVSADGVRFSLVASSQAIFRRLCTAIGKADVAQDPRFLDNPGRVANTDALNEILDRSFGASAFDELSRRLGAAGVPHSKIYTIEDIIRDPQFLARQAIIRLPDPELGSIPAPCIVPRVPGRTLPVPRSGPATGEHNDEVYRSLGFGQDEIAQLKRDGVI
jgi:crotonobetainyl-CoA:carnitine CoA-transferase CaiB-like acyl-CoA transferase